MAETCGTCKAKAKYEYWQNLPVTKHKFFKLMLGNFEHQLRIPREFVENFKGNLSSQCTLRGPGGKEWVVRVGRREEDVLFLRGWDSFVMDHGIEKYDFLVFSYVDDSTFEVFVFDGSGCEREGSHFVDNNLLEPSCGNALHMERNDSANKEEEIEFSFGESENARMQQASLIRRNNRRARRTRYNALYKGRFRVDSLPRCEMFGDDDDQIDNDSATDDQNDNDNDDQIDNDSATDDQNDNDNDDQYDNGGDNAADDDDYKSEEEEETEESFHYGPRLFKPRNQTQKCHISKRRGVTDLEKQRACTKAEEHLQRNKSKGVPMVGIIMLPTHVYKGLYLTIPKEWAREHMIRNDHQVELQVSGADDFWLVGCRWSKVGQCQLRPRWAEFVLDNNLEEGDVCVFELVHKASKIMPVFLVWIFRVVSEVVPLTCKRIAV